MTGVVLAALLTCHFKGRFSKYYNSGISSAKHEGLDNPNYGEVDPHGSQHTSTQIAVDYEAPQSNHTSAKYINIPSQNLAHSSSNSGIYSYVIVEHPKDAPMSYDSNFLQSSGGSWELPSVATAETVEPMNGRLTSNYSLLDNEYC